MFAWRIAKSLEMKKRQKMKQKKGKKMEKDV